MGLPGARHPAQLHRAWRCPTIAKVSHSSIRLTHRCRTTRGLYLVNHSPKVCCAPLARGRQRRSSKHYRRSRKRARRLRHGPCSTATPSCPRPADAIEPARSCALFRPSLPAWPLRLRPLCVSISSGASSTGFSETSSALMALAASGSPPPRRTGNGSSVGASADGVTSATLIGFGGG